MGLRQATPHPEVLFTSSQHACHQRHDRVQLERRLPEILEQIASNARERLRTTGEARVAVAHLPSSLWPVTGDPAATKLVEDALRENEPHTASVEFEQNTRLIDPAGRITLVARFDPPLT